MTQKELSYVEDAIGHEKSIIRICEEILNVLDDKKLITFMKKELSNHQKIEQELMNLLEVESNG